MRHMPNLPIFLYYPFIFPYLAYPICLSSLLSLYSIRIHRTHSILSVYLLYFSYTPCLLYSMLYSIWILILYLIPPVYLAYIPYTMWLSNPRFAYDSRLPAGVSPPTWMDKLSPYSTRIGNGQLEKYAICIANLVGVAILTFSLFPRPARPHVCVLPYYRACWFEFLQALPF